MPKSTAMILKGVAIATFFLCASVAHTKAQFISMNEPKRKELKASANIFKVAISEEEKKPLSFQVKVNNPDKETVRAYLRNRNGYNFLGEKVMSRDANFTMKLNLAPLDDGEYTFVVKSENGFFIKHFNLQSGDLMTAKINGKETMTINRTVMLVDE
ncbi:MAG: hypothetical protein U5N85_20665 [Arcicella sp.]|nr:hypothetical protein [Arcicella sp.]